MSLIYYLRFKELQVFKTIDDVLYRLLSGRAYDKDTFYISRHIHNLVDNIGYGLTKTNYNEIGDTKFCTEHGYNYSFFIADEIFDAVYQEKDFNRVLDRLACCKFEVDMARLYNETKLG